ncbi:MAG: aminotransferase class V-fold PLP-dependent enzyme [Spirochaetales bacterium]|nr:MAG: aminotransferase class V-fold PLP-dependent enzyme [Spirochaetales bacterium]
MTKRKVYMDNNATTPLHPEVKNTIIESFDLYGNPSSMHEFGRIVRARVEEARVTVAGLINADPHEIIFTGGGSESNNTVLKRVTCPDRFCFHCADHKNEIVTSVIEHPSVLQTADFLKGSGVPVHYIPVDRTGKVDMNVLSDVVTDRTFLVSIMFANNEIGTIQDIREIVKLAHSRGALVHTDAVQAIGKVPVDVRSLDVDFLSLSGHKLYAPKGIGVLYVKKGSPFCTFIHGGHQEDGRRAGTLNNTGILGLGKAAEIALKEGAEEAARLLKLKARLLKGIEERIPDIVVNGHPVDCLPGTLNVSFPGAEGESILLYLDLEGIAVSTGSACATGSLEPSHVLLATGLGPEIAHGSIRFSMGRENTDEDVDYILEKLPPVISRIRKMSTAYQGGKA